MEQFNNNVAEPFNDYIHKLPGLMFCLDGDGHHIQQDDLDGDGTIFYMTASTNDICFMRFYRNASADFWDVFDLSFGIKSQLF